MSKITQQKKDEKLKGKQKRIAEATFAKSTASEKPVKKSGIPNIGCCCTCIHFPHKVKHETQPCKVSKKYVARKAKFDCYKCKFD